MAKIFLIDASLVAPDAPFVAQPVGLLSIASVLRNAGHQLAVHDCKLGTRSLPRRLREFRPDFVGIRGLTLYRDFLEDIARLSRGLCPDAVVVIGGPHPTTQAKQALLQTDADLAVLGEGEETFREVIEVMSAGETLEAVKGVAWLEDGELVITEPRPPIEDLDSLPMPAYDLVPMEEYFRMSHASTAPSGRSLTMVTTRGCPYGCSFCHNIFGQRFRARSPGALVVELLYLKDRYQFEEVEFHDDCFNLLRDRTLDFSRRMQEKGSPLLIAFPNGLRGDLLDREVLTELRRAGTHHLGVAPETASERLQRMLGKNMKLDRLLAAAEISVELGIFTQGFFMLGFPGETEEELKATVDMACNTSLHIASFHVVNPVPGTRLWQQASESGRVDADPKLRGYSQVNVNLTAVSDERFRAIWKGAYRRFYMNPRRLASIFRDVPAKSLLFRNGLFTLKRLI